MATREIKLGEPLFAFETQIRWECKAKSWYANCGVRSSRTIAIDSEGRVCVHGVDFRQAVYPVTVYPAALAANPGGPEA